ncbi:hypothetical protein TrRE_jg2678, partial [Triparma retinervis]
VTKTVIPQSCLGDVKVRIEPLKSNEHLDDSCHSDISSDISTASSTSTETIPSSPPSNSSPTNSILSSSPPISIPVPSRSTPLKHKKRSRSGLVKSSALSHPGVSFSEDVKVLPIPLRHEYSSRIRSHMYSSAEELYRNASRNTKEFMSEGWSVDGVVEEEGMITWGGQLIHPVHLVSQR